MQLRNIAIETNVLNLLWSNSTCPPRQITDKQQRFSSKKEIYVSLYNVNICEFIFEMKNSRTSFNNSEFCFRKQIMFHWNQTTIKNRSIRNFYKFLLKLYTILIDR